MVRKRRDDLEQAIEEALSPGAFIDYDDDEGFIEDLEGVRGRIGRLIEEGEAGRAVTLFETFIAGCYEKSDEVDDSDGAFGQFVEGLFCEWICARQAAGADRAETARLLCSWMDRDEYGYCHGLEKEAVKVLDRAGLAAFEGVAREKAGAAEKDSYPRRRNVEILKAIYQARGDVDAYAALCETEGGPAPADCEVLAEMCLKRRRLQEGLVWVERGLDLEAKDHRPGRSAWRLPDLRREILKRLGRGADALASAWEDYQRAPSVHSYADLMKFVPKGERSEWHSRALAALDGADLASRIDFLVKTKERDRLAAAVEAASRERLVRLSHYTTEPAAKCLEKPHPLLAAKLHVAMALRILEAKKSKYYDAALANLERARKLLLSAGRDEEWRSLAAEIREVHRRKGGFMPGFEKLAEGRSTREPSFLDRARKRWRRGAGDPM